MTELSHKDLTRKWAVACFVREGVSDQTREAFEDAYALGRAFLESYSIFPTRSHADSTWYSDWWTHMADMILVS